MQNLFVYKYAVLFAFALFLSVLLNTIFLKFSRNLGRRDQDDSIVRWSSISKPSLGGISFYIIFYYYVLYFWHAGMRHFSQSFPAILKTADGKKQANIMKKVTYTFSVWLLKGIARLPLSVLYLFSDIMFFLMFYVVR